MPTKIAAIALAGAALVSTTALRAQDMPYDMRDMVGAHTPQADGEMARRGYARVAVESRGGRDWTFWWNAERRSCLAIAIARGRFESINGASPADCRNGGRPGGPGGPGWGGGPGGPGGPGWGGGPGGPGGPGWGGDNRPGVIPRFSARCPMGIDVRSDWNGPFYINRKQARTTVSRNDYWEARSGRTTVSISRNRDGSITVQYLGPNRIAGACQVGGY